MAHRRARKLVKGAEPPQEVVAVVDGFAAVANALKESTDALPAVKGICGAVDWIVVHIKASAAEALPAHRITLSSVVPLKQVRLERSGNFCRGALLSHTG